MGMPEIIIEFQSKAGAAVGIGQRGVVALILKDSTKTTFDTKEYNAFDEVTAADWTAKSYDYIKQAFLGAPRRVIVERLAPSAVNYSDALKRLKTKRWNWLAVPELNTAGRDEIKMYIQNTRTVNKGTFKAVIANCAAGNEGVVNFVASDIAIENKTYSAEDYTPRIAGIFAGLPLDRSATFYPLPEVVSITEPANPDADISAGKLILVNDGAKIKIARAVTSHIGSPELRKVKIVEGQDIIKGDIRDVFNDFYVGKVLNTYDNKIMFLAACNAYLTELEGLGVLDPGFDNRLEIDIAAQRNYLAGKNVDVSSLGEQELKEYNTGSRVFLSGAVKFADAMEDMQLKIEM